MLLNEKSEKTSLQRYQARKVPFSLKFVKDLDNRGSFGLFMEKQKELMGKNNKKLVKRNLDIVKGHLRYRDGIEAIDDEDQKVQEYLDKIATFEEQHNL